MSDRKRILITGAGGFIGGRIAEIFHTLDVGDVRAGMRRWATGARVGRFPVELVKCDIRSEPDVARALEGVTHIVHCAVGDRSTTVEGTRTLLRRAQAQGVQRVVHISTIDVYGTPEGRVDESHRVELTGRPYGDTKIEAENVCRELARDGLPVTILRPTLVHGPFSATWTMAYAQRLQVRPWLVPAGLAGGTCNLVYVDDLVGAIMAALDADVPTGEAFNINGPDRVTWNEYFHALNRAMGLPPLDVETPGRARRSARLVDPLRKSAKFMLRHFEKPIMEAYRRSQLARTVMKRAEGVIRSTPAPAEFSVYSRDAVYPTDKAERMLGYQPRFPLDRALDLTGEWLRRNGFVTGAVSANGTGS